MSEARSRSGYYHWRYLRIRQLVDWFKARPCADCGQMFPVVVMDFDHRDPTEKTYKIAQFVGRMSKLLAEIAKCDVVCSNCHRIRTWQSVGSLTLPSSNRYQQLA